MMAKTWDELWEEIDWDRVTTIPFITERIHEIKAMGDRLNSAITQIHECLGEYESKEWCGHCIADSKCAQITMHIIELKKKADTLTFLFGEKGVKTENLMKIQAWREKAETFDQAVRQAFIKYFGEGSIEREDFQAGDYGANDSIDLANTIWKILEARDHSEA